MTRPRALGDVTRLAACLLTLLPLELQAPRIFHAETNLVVLHATVKNAGRAGHRFESGRLHGLRQWKATEDYGIPPRGYPVSLGLLIDNSGSMRSVRAKVEAAALACVRASRSTRRSLRAELWRRPTRCASQATSASSKKASRASIRLGAGHARCDRRGIAVPGRLRTSRTEVLLVITDGKDNASVASLEEIRKRAQQREVTVYAIGLLNEKTRPERQRPARAQRVDRFDRGSRLLPGESRGHCAIALGIAHEIRNQYTIAFNRTARLMVPIANCGWMCERPAH